MQAMSEIGLFDAIYSARSLRRLKPDPVPAGILTQILDAAICTPSAGNARHWAFILVRDAEQRQRLGAIYRKASDIASAIHRDSQTVNTSASCHPPPCPPRVFGLY